MEEELNMLKTSETYKTVANIENWDDYFADAKSKLTEELNTFYESEIKE